jgi:hypothetical protein
MRISNNLLIIASFAQVHEDQVATHESQLVFVNKHNKKRMSVELI